MKHQVTPRRIRQAHKGHKPAFIGGRVCTVHCECGWRTGEYVSARGAWAAYREHEQEFEQEQP